MMRTSVSPASEPVTPSAAESALARQSLTTLAALLRKGGDVRVLTFGEGEDQMRVELPTGALRLLREILSEMAEGNSLTLIPIHAELTTQEAADYLNLSRPFLVRLLDTGEIEHHRVGSHRRVSFSDVLAYQRRMRRQRIETLDELTAQAQELNMGY